ncbi:HpcH/HpaI aldolase family protein [Kribbella shirazensis]|uniref:2-keto-3-deoxy-L-rhamnonate aldolase RhmA n=1 Tax=Kribbella shirazensis TaxID=1105143 RepID=A0A7X5VHX2_9ACTN|nr:aldolase/citrate lyase family protein [Kribbella shirazensis]NIK61512.1 2-keto-3-deoxy-L-rhamnonate aldolase RhmA [Kribbella shirazensis]
MTTTFVSRLRASEAGDLPLRGLWLTCLTPYAVELADLGAVDWLGVDLQHGDVDAGDLAPLLRASPVPVLARLAGHDPSHVARVLDTGVEGIIVPAVESADQAAALVAASNPPPVGTRSTGVSRAGAFGKPQPLLLPMVETALGLDALEEIAAVAGVDGIFVGPYDLSLSLGASSVVEPVVVKAIETVVATAHRHGLLAGVFAGNADLAARLPAVELVAVDTDLAALRAGIRQLFGQP